MPFKQMLNPILETISIMLYNSESPMLSNMAEIESHASGRQCTDRRIGDVEILKHKIAYWEEERNQRHLH